jgi:phenylalanyl-tRNA synthetase alpha chain
VERRDLENNWSELITSVSDLTALEEVRIKLFGKKGYLAGEFAKMKSLSPEEKKKLCKRDEYLKGNINSRV